jgi:serine/threonine-protein phosphatase PGAM5
MGERILYLVRHGQLDLDAYEQNPRTAGLTAMGRRQAHFTAGTLDALDVRVIHCSTITRAIETAEIISRRFPEIRVRRSPLLREIPGPDRLEFAEAIQRVDQVFARLFRPARGKERVELVICHGNLIRCLACKVLGVAPESFVNLGTSHCGITQVRVTEGAMRLFCYNDTSHLPARLRS